MRKNGFTLIELLAVIVVLAIIALIATPIVLNIINNAKTSSNERSGELYIKAVENAIMKKQMSGTNTIEAGTYTVQSDGSICIEENNVCESGTTIEVSVDGILPAAGGTITINEKGVVTAYNMTVSGTSIVKGYCSANDEVNNNNIKIVDGQNCGVNDIGCEVQIDNEHFYVIGTDTEDSNNVNLLAKYNLKVGNKYNVTSNLNYTKIGSYTSSDSGYNLQSDDVRGLYCTGTFDLSTQSCNDGIFVSNGILEFSSDVYWRGSDWAANTMSINSKYGTQYPAYVYDNNSKLYDYIENYKDKLYELYNVDILNARLLKLEEATTLGCDESSGTCITETVTSNNRQWLYNTTYWLGTAMNGEGLIYNIMFIGLLYYHSNDYEEFEDYSIGVRPVITVSKTLFN